MTDFMTGKPVTQEESEQIQENLTKLNKKPFLWYNMFKRVMLIEWQVGPECKITASWKDGYDKMKVKLERFYNGEKETWYETPKMLREMFDCCKAPTAGFVPWPIMEWMFGTYINHIDNVDLFMTKEMYDEATAEP